MGYDMFGLNKTRHQAGKSLILQLELTGYLGKKLTGCGILEPVPPPANRASISSDCYDNFLTLDEHLEQ